MYRTGDRGYWLGDGNLRLAGRRDRQVKRHGVRINLDAVEASLAAVSSIEASAVFCDADTQRMVAMVTLHEPRPLAWIPIDAPQAGPSRIAVLGELPERQLWAEVVAALPVNLLPDRLVVLDRLPRTSGGKVNYGLLAQLSCRAANEYRDVHEAAAASPTEQALIAICERVLHRSGVKSGERFLELGMSSLQLVQVMHAVAETFSIRLKLSQLYGAASLRQCAELIDTEVEAVAALLEELA